jgi:predicted nucleotidyltransferase
MTTPHTLGLVLQRLDEQAAPLSHTERLQRLVGMAQQHHPSAAIALVGSYAKGTGDRVSDLDLVVIAEETKADDVLSKAHDALHDDTVLNCFSGRHKSAGAFHKLVYLDFSSVELHVFPRSSSFRLKNPFLSVWDPQLLLPAYVTSGDPVRHEDFPAYEFGDDGLIWELVDCIKWLSRGNLPLAKQYLRKLGAELEHNASSSGTSSAA